MKYEYPDYNRKVEFTPGANNEKGWKLGETACVDRAFFVLPNGSEYAIFKFAERTITGGKKLRWEKWHNGKFSNNYFTCFADAVKSCEDEIKFFGFPDSLQKYRIY